MTKPAEECMHNTHGSRRLKCAATHPAINREMAIIGVRITCQKDCGIGDFVGGT